MANEISASSARLAAKRSYSYNPPISDEKALQPGLEKTSNIVAIP